MYHYKEHDSRKFRDTSRYLPKGINLSVIDYNRMREIDRFYNACQMQRDYYKDHSGHLRCVPDFKEYPKQFASKECPTAKYMRQPVSLRKKSPPIFYSSLETGRLRDIPRTGEIDFHGKHNATPCSRFKR